SSRGVRAAIAAPPADMLMGIGGAPEAVITACALKCLGGEIQCKLWPRNEQERALAQASQINLSKVYCTNDLVQGENVFFAATGITEGEFLRGVRYYGGGARTHSVVTRLASVSVRYIESSHRWDKLMRISSLQYAGRANGGAAE